jgi:Tfp pilus assembly protein FimT
MKVSKGTTQLMIAFALLAIVAVSLSLSHLTFSASDEETTSSSADITKQVAISKSANLTTGILFGTLDPDSDNNNATGNFNDTDQMTQFWLTIDDTTNTPIDICTKDSAPLTKAGDNIPNTNYKWNSTTTNSAGDPYISGDRFAITTSYDTVNKIADSQTSGTYYLRFTLDVPAAQPAGSYSNTVYFKGADDVSGC